MNARYKCMVPKRSVLMLTSSLISTDYIGTDPGHNYESHVHEQ